MRLLDHRFHLGNQIGVGSGEILFLKRIILKIENLHRLACLPVGFPMAHAYGLRKDFLFGAFAKFKVEVFVGLLLFVSAPQGGYKRNAIILSWQWLPD